MNVCEYFRFAELPDGYGIEIETEGNNLIGVDNQYWGYTKDGSLRGEAYEYVTKGPILIENLPKAIAALNRALDKAGAEPHYSYRTSTHVHMNVQRFTREQLIKLVYLWIVFEESLVRFSGKSRIGNRFCLRIRDAEGLVDQLVKDFNRYEFPCCDGEIVRYAAINLAAVQKYGSVEFRSFRGTNNQKDILEWVSLLDCLKKMALNPLTVKELYNLKIDAIGYIVFGEAFNKIKYAGFEEDARYNISRCIELVHELKSFEPKKEVKKRVIGNGRYQIFFDDPLMNNPAADINLVNFNNPEGAW